MADISKIKLPDNTEYEIKDAKARMVILSYGNSTWNDFITAYQNKCVVYCRASSNSNPATGSQTRLAFMAYVSNADTPTNVEFQYYRSMSKHTDAQQGDQVFVYKLTNANKWTVTTRNAFSKVIAGTNLTSSFVESETNSSITLSADYDSTVTQNSTKLITSGAVYNAIANQPVPDLTDLPDVTITTPSDGDVLTYDSTNNEWVNEAGGGAEVEKGTIQNVSIASFTDGADNVPVSSLIVDIDANPEGFTEANITRLGKNLLNNPDTTITGASYVINNVNVPMVAGRYVLSFDFSGTSNSTSLRIDDENGTAIFTTAKTITNGSNKYLINLPSKGSFVKLFSNAVGTYSKFQIEQGNEFTSFEPYNDTTYNIPFGQSVTTGGTLNVTTGVLEITGGSTIQLTPTQVRTLLNDNNIFADTGNINELVYFKTGCEGITELIGIMHDDSKMSYSNAYGKKTCNQLTDPGIYYDIDTTGSPAEGYTMTTLITTYNCQILVYLGLVVNIRRVNRPPRGTISFSPWMRLANEDDLDGVVIPYNAEYPSLGTIYDVIESIRSPSTQTVTLAANSWDSSTHLITVSVTGVTSTSVQDVIGLPATSPANISNNEALQDANIMDAGQSTGSLTFYAETVPTTDLQIRVIVRG